MCGAPLVVAGAAAVLVSAAVASAVALARASARLAGALGALGAGSTVTLAGHVDSFFLSSWQETDEK